MKKIRANTVVKYSAIGSALLLSLTLGTAAQANKLEEIKKRGTLVCGTQNASAPYGFQDPATRQYVGYDVDICNELAKKLNVKLEHKPLSTEARIPEVKLDRVDLVAGSVAWLPKRAEEVDFSYQYLEGYIKVLVAADSGINTLADLKGKKICASSGSSSAAIAEKVLKGADVLTYQNISQCYLGIQSGKVAGMTAGELVLLRFYNDAKETKKPMKLLAEPTYTEQIGLIFKKDEPELKVALDEALVELDQSGELTRLFDKWMGESTSYGLKRNFTVGEIEPTTN